MNLFTIAFKSIKQRWLASSLTSLSVALGVMLMVAVLVFHGIIERMFAQQSIGYDLVVGPKGSELQLVLSSVYRISRPIENVPYLYYEELKNHKWVKTAVPIALGDTTDAGSFPIVGTTGDYLTTPYRPAQKGEDAAPKFLIRWDANHLGKDSDGKSKSTFRKSLDAIIGSEVARRNGWDLGSEFKLVHAGQQDHVHDELFTVVGVMKRTGTPNDRTVFVPLEGFYSIAEHAKPEKEMRERLEDFFDRKYTDKEWDALRKKVNQNENDWSLREVTAIFVTVRRKPGEPDSAATVLSALLKGEINSGYSALAVNPIDPMKKLMDEVVGNIRKAVLVLIGLIIAVSGVSIFVSIYNSMADRKKEIAIMRALGARRQTVFAIILAESILLCFGGGLLGILLGHGLVFGAAPFIEWETGLIINPWAFERLELLVLPVLLAMASLVGFVPGMTAYRTDVADALGG
ncbi:MAG: ABC transporter permease [Planctomycetaceae bacterium]